MIQTFGQLLAFVAVLLAFALAIILPFLWFLNRNLKNDKEMAESCHNFQRELNRQTLIGFNRNSDAINLNTEALTMFMAKTLKDNVKPPPPPASGE